MDSNEEIALNVSYEPTEWGNSEERMVLVCDNCQVGARGTASKLTLYQITQYQAVSGYHHCQVYG